jgi:hypothetical protein
MQKGQDEMFQPLGTEVAIVCRLPHVKATQQARFQIF